MKTDLLHRERHQKKAVERVEQRDRRIRELEEKIGQLERLQAET
jgi:hypothetical protein